MRDSQTAPRFFIGILFFIILFGYFAGVVWAHGGGVPQLTNASAGPYLVSVWTQPDPLRVGEVHFTAAVSEPSAEGGGPGEAGAPVLGASVELQLEPVDGNAAPLFLSATHENAVNKLFYEVDTELSAPGQWQVVVFVEGAAGSGTAGFEIEVLPPSNSGRMLLGAAGLLCLTVAASAQAYRKGANLTLIIAAAAFVSIVTVAGITWLGSFDRVDSPAIAETSPSTWIYWKNKFSPGKEALVVEVIASQWTYRFNYPDAEITSSNLVLPLEQTALVKMTSADVVHSFVVSEFGIEQTIIPGRYTQLRVTPIRPGTYQVRCETLCGLSAADMLAKIKVMSPADFEAWSARQQEIAND